MQHGYEPSRIHHLTRRSRWAVGALDGIHSTDPAAAEAMSAIAGLKSLIADEIVPATAAIADVDPLGRPGHPARSLLGADWYADWLGGLVATDYSEMTDDELFAELERLEEHLPYDDDFQPDMDDPHWDGFEQLSIELAVRAEIDEAFAARLADEAADTFLIPLAVHFANFDPELVGAMLITVSEWPSWSIDLQSNYRTFAAELLVDVLTDHPMVSLDVLVHPDADRGDDTFLLEDLLLWPGLDTDVVARFLDAAMSAPFARPDQLTAAGTVLQQLVAMANGTSFPDGFPSELSPVLAKIVVQYLPFFVTSLDDWGDVHLKGFDRRDIGLELGSYGEVVDLFGALARDPISLEILLGVIPTLTLLGSDAGGPLDVHVDDVADYLRLLRNAATNEQLEEAIEAAQARETADLAIDLIIGAIDLIASVTGPLKDSTGAPLHVIKTGAKLFADWAISATDLGLDAVATLAYLLMAYGIGVSVVRDRDDSEDDDETTENVRRAEDILDEIEDALANGSSIEDVQGLVRDLQRIVGAIDGDATSILGDVRVAPPEYDVEEDVDTER